MGPMGLYMLLIVCWFGRFLSETEKPNVEMRYVDVVKGIGP